jgi:two-component system LytT family response regulator
VRFDRIRALEPYGKSDHVPILADGTRVPVSREGYARLRELLE